MGGRWPESAGFTFNIIRVCPQLRCTLGLEQLAPTHPIPPEFQPIQIPPAKLICLLVIIVCILSFCSLCILQSVFCICCHTADGPRDALCQSKSCQCDTPVGTGCTTNPQQIGVTELERYGRRTCSKPRASCHHAVHRRKCGQQARQSISFVNCPHDRMPWGNMHLVKVNLTQGRIAAARGSVYIIHQGPY